MQTRTNNTSTAGNFSADITDRSIVSVKRSALLGIVAFFILGFLVGVIIYERTRNFKQNKKEEILRVADNARLRLQESLAFSLNATKTLAFFVQKDGQVKNFDSIATLILGASNDIDAIQLLPAGVIKYIYPLKGNEKAIGLDILNDPARKKGALNAIKNKKLFLAGPLELVQGGQAVVGRFPVYRNDKFWGFTAVVIKIATLLNAAGIDSSGNPDYKFQLSKYNPDTKKEEYYLPKQKYNSYAQTISLNIPDGDWKLSVIPVKKYSGFGDVLLISLLGLLISVQGGIFVYNISRKPKKLDDLVKTRTRQLNERELKYRSLIEQASDGIIITDLTGNIKEVNQSIARMGDYESEYMLGKHVNEFIPFEDIEANPFQFDKLLDGSSLLVERRFLKKDGTFIFVEVISKMTLSKTLIGFVRDITERKKSEEVLQYQSRLLDAVSDAITSLDMNRCIVSWNKTCEELYGFTKDEVIGKRIPELVTFNYQNTTNEKVFNEVFVKGQWKGEFNFIHPKSNKRIHLLSSINLLKAKEGNINGFIISSKDITDMVNIKEQILKEIKLSDSIINSLPGIFYLCNKQGKFVRWNSNFETVTGYTKEEISSLHPFELFDEPDKTLLLEKIENVFEKGEDSMEANFLLKNKQTLLYYFTGQSIEYEGETCLMGVGIDISEREKAAQIIKESEEKYRTLVDQASDGIFIADQSGKFIVINSCGIKMSQFSEEELKKMTIYDLVHPEDIIKEPFHFADMAAGKIGRAERRMIRKDGTMLDVEVTAKFISGNRFLAFVRDITEFKKTKQELEKEYRDNKAMINSTNDLLWCVNNDFDLIVGNVAFIKYIYEKLGLLLKPGDKVLRPDLFAEEYIQFWKKLYKKALDGEVFFKEIHGVETLKFSVFEVSMHPIINGDKILGVACFARDISESKKSAKDLQESESRYRGLLNNLDAGIVVHAPDTSIVKSNPKASELLGLSESQMKGKMAIDPDWKFVYENNEPLPLESYPVNYIATQKKGFKNVIFGVNRPVTNDMVWLVVNGFPVFDSNDELVEIVISFIDITERKKAEQLLKENEERLRLSLKAANQGLYDLNIQTGNAIVNEQYASMLGYDPKTFVETNQFWFERLHPDDLEATSKIYQDYINGLTNEYKVEFRQKTKDNNWKWILSLGKIVEKDKEGKPLRMLGTHTDVTERKKAEEEIKANSELLRELYSYSQNIREEERTHIAREIHDELGQQLTGLKMDLFWINRRLKNTDEIIKNKLNETLGLIDITIQTVRKIATELRPSILDDLGLVAALEWQGEEFEKRAGINVKFLNNLDETILQPVIVTALFRIYQELLTNVARHSGATKVNTSIYIDNNILYLSVEDNGIGFNSEGVIGKKTLGLRGIKERTNLIGGTYEIKTRPGQGTFVLIFVPL